MSTIQLFLQFEGHRRIEIVRIDENATVQELLAAAARVGLPDDRKDGAAVFAHDGEAPLNLDLTLKAAGICNKHRVHVHRCKKVEVMLHFNELTEKDQFPPAATVDKVKKEFVKKIKMSAVDAGKSPQEAPPAAKLGLEGAVDLLAESAARFNAKRASFVGEYLLRWRGGRPREGASPPFLHPATTPPDAPASWRAAHHRARRPPEDQR